MWFLVGWLGMVLYSVYADCDPITAGQVGRKDQMLPLHVLHVAGGEWESGNNSMISSVKVREDSSEASV